MPYRTLQVPTLNYGRFNTGYKTYETTVINFNMA